MNINSKITIKLLAESIYPNWGLGEWLEWPPNTFALISILFQRTGAYKLCLTKIDAIWDDADWQRNIEFDANLWLNFSNEIIEGGDKNTYRLRKTKISFQNIKIIKKHWDSFDLNKLRLLGTDDDTDQLISSLIAIFAVADYSCRGLGLIGENIKERDKEFKLVHYVSNLLLNNYGSLATIPKFHGIALPKMRTPQSGLVLRSLSHYLTFHVTEVEVIWRTFPWLNNHKQSLNILAVPYPFYINDSHFKIIDDKYHSVRYFEPAIKESEDFKFKIDALVDKIKEHSLHNTEIDILVLPETALESEDYYYLLDQLKKILAAENSNFVQLPIIICGVLDVERDKNPSYSFHNEVRMATFFANKWYEIKQRKHHRWQLDRNQILQYNLEGKFVTDKNWFEHGSISQRRLTILSPNSWLAMTSLICEDLARQEPVAELIRGIGPTLLIALLSDGPQLNFRWSARYASILADDPGTAVLSLTSLGMVKQSQITDKDKNNLDKPTTNKYTVGLWKDMIRGSKELNLEKGNHALLFTISAKFIEEFTIDGRTDYNNASVFRIDTLIPRQVKIDYEKETKGGKTKIIDKKDLGDWEDIRDVSALMYAVDCIIDIMSLNAIDSTSKKKKQIRIILDFLKNDDPSIIRQGSDFFTIIQNIINISWKHPEQLGIEKYLTRKNNVTPSREDVLKSIEVIYALVDDNDLFTTDTLFNFYETLLDKIEAKMGKPDFKKDRVVKITYYAFLYDIMSKISKWKPKELEINVAQNKIKSKELIVLKNKIRTLLEKK